MTDKHQQRMAKVKTKVDARIAEAQTDKGLLLVFTGNGKGKSTAGFGTVTRAVGHGLTAVVAQFIKGEWACGERNILTKLGVPFAVMNTGFTWDTQDKTADTLAAEKIWQQAKTWLTDASIDLVLLDELTYMLSYKYLALDEVLGALNNRPAHQHVIITGRACHRAVIELADTVTEMRCEKHAFDNQIKAQQGIDW